MTFNAAYGLFLLVCAAAEYAPRHTRRRDREERQDDPLKPWAFMFCGHGENCPHGCER